MTQLMTKNPFNLQYTFTKIVPQAKGSVSVSVEDDDGLDVEEPDEIKPAFTQKKAKGRKRGIDEIENDSLDEVSGWIYRLNVCLENMALDMGLPPPKKVEPPQSTEEEMEPSDWEEYYTDSKSCHSF